MVTKGYTGMVEEREIRLERPDCTLIGTILLPDKVRATILIMHGWSTDRQNLRRYSEMLAQHGYRIVAFDARGHGETMVKPDLHAMIGDVGAILDMLTEDYGVTSVGTFGWSMGGLIPTISSTLYPTIKAVSTIATGVHLWPNLIHQILKLTPIPELLYRALRRNTGKLNHISPIVLLQAIRAAPNAMDYADKVTVPYLSIHPVHDVLIPLEAAKRLFEAIPSKDKEFIVINASHDIAHTHYDEIAPRILEFFDKRLC